MKLEPREYQKKIYDSIKRNGNSLVVLPTGLGKTLIALMLIKDHKHSLFLTPTKPLAEQHTKTIKEVLETEDVVCLTGELPPIKRKELYSKKIVVATPQTVANDIDKGIVPEFDLIIFDECHRAVGNYAYTKIANSLSGLFVGLTASPGGDSKRIKEVMDALKIKNVEIRSYQDEDVKEHTHKRNITWKLVMLSPHFKQIKSSLEELIKEHSKKLANLGFPPPIKYKGQFIALREKILQAEPKRKFPALIEHSILMHLVHMLELIETQGIYPLREYIKKIESKTSKSAKILLKDPIFNRIKLLAQKDEEHPKLKVLLDVLKNSNKKAIVFVQYRSQIEKIEQFLKENGLNAAKFVGKRGGFTRKMQEEAIKKFREGEIDVLVASSVGEEGLDIPAVDLVIFYEPVPSEIRSIQRRGRTGRFREGEIIVLITKDTRDQAYYYASKKKEEKMKNILKRMQSKKIGQKKITEFS